MVGRVEGTSAAVPRSTARLGTPMAVVSTARKRSLECLAVSNERQNIIFTSIFFTYAEGCKWWHRTLGGLSVRGH
jgi:hypothetical protein